MHHYTISVSSTPTRRLFNRTFSKKAKPFWNFIPSQGFNAIFLFLMLSLINVDFIAAQNNRISDEINSRADVFTGLQPTNLLQLNTSRNILSEDINTTVSDAIFYNVSAVEVNAILGHSPDELKIELNLFNNESTTLLLTKAEIFSESFQVYTATDRENPFPFERGAYYWGTVENMNNSLVGIAITRDEVMGFIAIGNEKYTIGKMENRSDGLHIIYKVEDLLIDSGISCHVDEKEHTIGTSVPDETNRQSSNNCIRMYVEVDYDIVVGKGGVQQAADYVTGAFSQVLLLYANDDIEMVINEMVVWNVQDPYTGPSTSNYLTQFRNYQNGNYNGDLAHLVGYNGGGGVAYLNVLCNSYYGVGYSAINPSYNNVPVYSWTIMVLAHEIGHNLGSEHTHACKWNGNNTAIDGCGPAAGYSEGCTGPIPQEGGTIMSYCHLNSVGINLNLGFGPQPGDRMRGQINNANCLESCSPPAQNDAGIIAILEPQALPCENNVNPIVRLQNFGTNSLTAVTINYQLGINTSSTYSWTGSLAQNATTDVILPNISYSVGTHTLQVYTSQPNGQTDENTANDGTSISFEYIENYCICNEATAEISPNPLTHSGSGQTTTIISFVPGSKNVSFTISNLSARTGGNPQMRYTDRVQITYVDGNGNTQFYGNSQGVFLGSNTNTVQVNISGIVSSVSIGLSNGQNNNFNGSQSVNFSTVNYCSGDEQGEICPDFDDNLIGTACDDGDPCTENAVYTIDCICVGTPIPGCGDDCPTSGSGNFSPNPLTHQGGGSSNSSIALPTGSSDASFTISNIGERTNGNPNQRYIDDVSVYYVNGNGSTVLYGNFSGTDQNVVNVEIAGNVQSVTVTLSNGQGTNVSQSVSLSVVAFCSSQSLGGLSEEGWAHLASVEIFPNPASGQLFLRFSEMTEQADVKVYNMLGQIVGTYNLTDIIDYEINLSALHISNQVILVEILQEGKDPILKKIMVQ